MSGVAVRTRGLTFGYPRDAGDLLVLDEVDLTVAAGELLCVVGPSGCGKTTLLHLLAGLQAPTAGTVALEPAGAASGITRAVVFQRPRLLPWRSVLDNAVYGLECRGVSRRAARPRAGELLERLGLAAHLHDPPHRLSEGMKQRVNLARALLVEPDLLLMDEPFSALDEPTRRSLQDDLVSLWQERGCTVVFVSHSVEEVVHLAERVVVLGEKPTGVRGAVSVSLPRPRRHAADPVALRARTAEIEALLGLE